MFRLFLRQERLKIINNVANITRLIDFGSLIMNVHTCLNVAQVTNVFNIGLPTFDKYLLKGLVLELALIAFVVATSNNEYIKV